MIDVNGNEIIKKKHSNWYKFYSLSVFEGKYYLTGTTRNKIVAYLEFNPENSMFKTTAVQNKLELTKQSK